MKTRLLIPLIAATLFSAHAYAEENFELEPCINGQVSASGLYPKQAFEDRAHELALEPCINAEVSESGLYASQQLEDRAGGTSIHEGSGLVAGQ